MISGYWHYDPWVNGQPYGPFAASTFPGFPIQTVGKAQLFTFGVTTNFGGGSSVNQFTASYMRNHNIQGTSPKPGPTLQSIGFAPPDQGGIYQLEGPDAQNWPKISLNNYTLGAFVVVRVQDAETYQLQDDFTKVKGTHTLKFGGDYRRDQINVINGIASNGFFVFIPG